MEMKVRLMEELEEHMPDTTKFLMGYMEGRQSTKRWICSEDDLSAMYSVYASYPHRDFVLWPWCDGRKSEGD